MKLFGDVTVNVNGMNGSVLGMYSQMKMLNAISQNIARFGQAGYQKQIPYKTSFAEYLGPFGIDTITDTNPGRMRASGNPLDCALQTKGFFQIQGSKTVRMTRDGRFNLDKNGYLLSLTNETVLGADGEPIKFTKIPGNLKDIKIEPNGGIYIYNRAMSQKEYVGKLSIASEDGTPLREFEVTQGYVEDSNVVLADEFFNMITLRRNFEGNRQAFIIQKENIDKLLQLMGRSQ